MTWDVSVHAPDAPPVGEYEAEDAFTGALVFAASVGAVVVWFEPPRTLVIQCPGFVDTVECTVRFSDPDGTEVVAPT